MLLNLLLINLVMAHIFMTLVVIDMYLLGSLLVLNVCCIVMSVGTLTLIGEG